MKVRRSSTPRVGLVLTRALWRLVEEDQALLREVLDELDS